MSYIVQAGSGSEALEQAKKYENVADVSSLSVSKIGEGRYEVAVKYKARTPIRSERLPATVDGQEVVSPSGSSRQTMAVYKENGQTVIGTGEVREYSPQQQREYNITPSGQRVFTKMSYGRSSDTDIDVKIPQQKPIPKVVSTNEYGTSYPIKYVYEPPQTPKKPIVKAADYSKQATPFARPLSVQESFLTPPKEPGYYPAAYGNYSQAGEFMHAASYSFTTPMGVDLATLDVETVQPGYELQKLADRPAVAGGYIVGTIVSGAAFGWAAGRAKTAMESLGILRELTPSTKTATKTVINLGTGFDAAYSAELKGLTYENTIKSVSPRKMFPETSPIINYKKVPEGSIFVEKQVPYNTNIMKHVNNMLLEGDVEGYAFDTSAFTKNIETTITTTESVPVNLNEVFTAVKTPTKPYKVTYWGGSKYTSGDASLPQGNYPYLVLEGSGKANTYNLDTKTLKIITSGNKKATEDTFFDFGNVIGKVRKSDAFQSNIYTKTEYHKKPPEVPDLVRILETDINVRYGGAHIDPSDRGGFVFGNIIQKRKIPIGEEQLKGFTVTKWFHTKKTTAKGWPWEPQPPGKKPLGTPPRPPQPPGTLQDFYHALGARSSPKMSQQLNIELLEAMSKPRPSIVAVEEIGSGKVPAFGLGHPDISSKTDSFRYINNVNIFRTRTEDSGFAKPQLLSTGNIYGGLFSNKSVSKLSSIKKPKERMLDRTGSMTGFGILSMDALDFRQTSKERQRDRQRFRQATMLRQKYESKQTTRQRAGRSNPIPGLSIPLFPPPPRIDSQPKDSKRRRRPLDWWSAIYNHPVKNPLELFGIPVNERSTKGRRRK